MGTELTKCVDDDGREHSEAQPVGETQGRRKENGRVSLILVVIEDSIGDNETGIIS